MQLPVSLKAAVEVILQDHELPALKETGSRLSRRYRAEIRDGRLHLAGEEDVAAYLAARLPATYAAVRASLSSLAERRPDYRPRTLLDVGAGPGTGLWAATHVFASIRSATMIEASRPAATMGETLAEGNLSVERQWIEADVTRLAPQDLPDADLVLLSYVLDELSPPTAETLLRRLWKASSGTLVVVEPGTPAGWRRILAARDLLMGEGAHVAAPCAHHAACPISPPDWCHFAERVERSRTHRLAKDAIVPYEDEKYAYLALSREAVSTPSAARVIGPPRKGKGKVQLKLCTPGGDAAYRLVTRRQSGVFADARRSQWGDRFDAGDADA